MSRTEKQLLDDILFFLQNERQLYGYWNRKLEQPDNVGATPADAGVSLKTIPDQSTKPEVNSKTGKMNSDSNQVNTSTNGGNEEIKKNTDTENKTAPSGTALDSCQTLDELRTLCEKADILKTDLPGTNLVFGVGNTDADLLLIGEAPGANEDLQGEPFVGRAGKLLNSILEAIGFSREDIYIANILKHRPPDNRNPTADERQNSLPYLLKQIDIINPKLILCLGKVSGTTLLGRDESLTNMRGVFHPFRNCELMVTYHPAALLRNPNWKRPTWEDVQLLKKRYEELGCKP